jgi:hypothetical protein
MLKELGVSPTKIGGPLSEKELSLGAKTEEQCGKPRLFQIVKASRTGDGGREEKVVGVKAQ